MRNKFWFLLMVMGLALAGCKSEGEASNDKKAQDALFGLRGGKSVALYTFEDGTLNANDWNNTAPEGGWTIKDGWVHSKGTRNKALWLKKPLPNKVRVEFDVRSESPDGDIKIEIFGDGSQHESGYILIFGGWRNKINTIARLDEHGRDRQVAKRKDKVEQGKVYKMAVVRTDNRVRWFLDRDKGDLLMEYVDPKPLTGAKHAHLGFNDWSVPLFFDNLAVYDLKDL